MMLYDATWSATTPMAHQLDALAFSMPRKSAALFMEQGTGKTKIVLDKTVARFRATEIDGLLIVAPNGVHRNWIVEELPKHLPFDLALVARAYRAGMSKRNAVAFEEVMRPQPGALRVLAINVEALSTPGGYAIAERFLRSGRMRMTVDESSTIKTPSARRTKHAIKLGRIAQERDILTGTPITQGPLDFYSQFEFLQPGFLGPTYTAFKNRYAEWRERVLSDGHKFRELVRYRNLEELKSKVATISFQVTKAECLDLPPQVYERRLVELHPQQMAVYRALVKDIMVELSATERVTAPHAITRLLRLQQIVGGFLPLDNEQAARQLPNPKLESLLGLIEELPSTAKVIVWARFRAELSAISAALAARYGPRTVARYWGDIAQAERNEGLERFNGERPVLVDGAVVRREPVPYSDQARFFVSQQHAGGYGLTLTAASHVIYFSNDFSLEARLQSEARAHRIGQKMSVTYTDLVAEGTIDEKILRALRNKAELADMFKTVREILS